MGSWGRGTEGTPTPWSGAWGLLGEGGGKLGDVNSKIIFKTKFRSALAHGEVDARGPHSLQRWRWNPAVAARVADQVWGPARPRGPQRHGTCCLSAPAPRVGTLCRTHAHDSSNVGRSGLPPSPAQCPPPPRSLPGFAPAAPPLILGDRGWDTHDLASSAPSPPA